MPNKKSAIASSPLPSNFIELPDASDSLLLEPKIYQEFRTTINTAITNYKQSDASKEKKITALKDMRDAIKNVDLHSLPRELTKATEFHQIKTNLFHQIKIASAEQGIRSILIPDKNNSLIAEIVANMPLDKADKLMTILAENNIKDLDNLYDINDESEDAGLWYDFLNNYSIEFLGGGNSKTSK